MLEPNLGPHFAPITPSSLPYLAPNLTHVAHPLAYLRPSDMSSHPMTTRARIGNLKPRALFTSKYALAVESHPNNEPKTLRQAIIQPQWVPAMQTELEALRRTGT